MYDADGVHVGQDDMSPADVRKLLGDGKISWTFYSFRRARVKSL